MILTLYIKKHKELYVYRYWNIYTQCNFLIFSTIKDVRCTNTSLLKYYHALTLNKTHKSFCIIPCEMLFSDIL